MSLFGALADIPVVHPANAAETKQVLAWCVDDSKTSCVPPRG